VDLVVGTKKISFEMLSSDLWNLLLQQEYFILIVNSLIGISQLALALKCKNQYSQLANNYS